MVPDLELMKSHKCFGGQMNFYRHQSLTIGSSMNFGLFIPPLSNKQTVPLLYWLSGLTCTEQNFATKSGFQQFATQYGIAVAIPDTSPRGLGFKDEEACYDFGAGASFYLDATRDPWAQHYKMHSYIRNELPELVETLIPFNGKRSVFGHSMGGHGALIFALRHPDFYESVSAFAPIVAPSQVPWGQKAFSGYLGDDQKAWQAYDALALINSGAKLKPCLVDQGDQDEFLEKQLKTHLLEQAIEGHQLNCKLRWQPGYDHSYYFIATFIKDHFEFHRQYL